MLAHISEDIVVHRNAVQRHILGNEGRTDSLRPLLSALRSCPVLCLWQVEGRQFFQSANSMHTLGGFALNLGLLQLKLAGKGRFQA